MLKIGDETSVEASETLQECYKRFKNDKYDGVTTSHINDVVKQKRKRYKMGFNWQLINDSITKEDKKL